MPEKPDATPPPAPSGQEEPGPSLTPPAPLGLRIQHRLEAALWSEMLAQLTAGFVHDFNNSLTGLGSTAEMGLMDLAEDHPLRANLVTIRDHSRFACGLLAKLGHLLQDRTRPASHHDLRTLVEESLALLVPGLPRRCKVDCRCGQNPIPVSVDPHAMRRLLAQLLLNAVTAVPTGVLHLTIEVRETASGDGATSVWTGHRAQPGMAAILVSDDGPGVDPDLLPGIFEAGRTNRPGRAGIGLGLAALARQVFLWKGGASIETKPGEGSAVMVWFPMLDLATLSETEPTVAPRRLLVAGEVPDWAAPCIEWLRTELHWEVLQVRERAAEALAAMEEPMQSVLVFGSKDLSINDLNVWQPFRKSLPWVRLGLVLDPALGLSETAPWFSWADWVVAGSGGVEGFKEAWMGYWAGR